MAGLTSMDSSGCSSALTPIAFAGCHAHCRSGQRDRPIACPLRRDWRCNAPAENYRATNCSCASPDRKACDDSSNNWTRTAAERISLRRNPQRLPASDARRPLPWCQARSSSPGATLAQKSPSRGRAGSFRFLLIRRGRKCGGARPTGARSCARLPVDYPAASQHFNMIDPWARRRC